MFHLWAYYSFCVKQKNIILKNIFYSLYDSAESEISALIRDVLYWTAIMMIRNIPCRFYKMLNL